MANKQSAIKELRKSKKRTANNARIATNIKHLYKECFDLISKGNNQEAKAKYIIFQQAIDKASKRHIISVNRARRKKAALTLMLVGKRQTTTKAVKPAAVAAE